MTRPVNFEWLQKRVTDLEVEVERLRGIIGEKRLGKHLHGIDVCAYCAEGDTAKEALRRMVEALILVVDCGYEVNNPDNMAVIEEALAFAKGVMK